MDLRTHDAGTHDNADPSDTRMLPAASAARMASTRRGGGSGAAAAAEAEQGIRGQRHEGLSGGRQPQTGARQATRRLHVLTREAGGDE